MFGRQTESLPDRVVKVLIASRAYGVPYPTSLQSISKSNRNVHIPRCLQSQMRHAAGETGLIKSSVHRVFKRAHWNSYIPTLAHASLPIITSAELNFVNGNIAKCEENSEFPKTVVWNDDATLEWLRESHNCFY